MGPDAAIHQKPKMIQRVNEPATKRNFLPPDFEKVERCPWCDSPDFQQWGEDAGYFNTVECQSCELIYVNRRLNAEAVKRYYRNYFSEEHQAVPEAKVRTKMYQLEFDYIARFIKRGKVLDIGCSEGEFLDYFEQAGFECFGVDVSEEAARIARQKYGTKIIQASLLEADIQGPFDLIVLRGTIEHIPEARETLNKAVHLLDFTKCSYLYITSTPNADAIAAKIFKTNWTQHLPEEHIQHFRKKHFDEFFAKHGLHCLAWHYFYEETPYANIEEDISKVAEAIRLKRENQPIHFKSPPFYGNMMSLVYTTQG